MIHTKDLETVDDVDGDDFGDIFGANSDRTKHRLDKVTPPSSKLIFSPEAQHIVPHLKDIEVEWQDISTASEATRAEVRRCLESGDVVLPAAMIERLEALGIEKQEIFAEMLKACDVRVH